MLICYNNVGYIYLQQLKVDASNAQARIFCIGHYPEILVMDPDDLQIVFSLNSRVEQDWIRSVCLLKPPNRPGCLLIINNIY